MYVCVGLSVYALFVYVCVHMYACVGSCMYIRAQGNSKSEAGVLRSPHTAGYRYV